MLEDSDEEDNEEGRVKEPRKGVLVVCTIIVAVWVGRIIEKN